MPQMWKKGHFARDCWSKTSVPSYQSPFQSKLLFSSENKPEPRQIKDFEAKYYKVKAKLALLSSSASAPSSSSGKNKGLITETYDWDDEEVSSDENEVTEVKALMALTNEEKVSVGKESDRNGDWIKISMKKHVNTEILKENQNLKFELKELTSITETWLNSSNIVNQCINEQIPTQKKKILGIDQLTEDTSSSGFKDPVLVKSSSNNLNMSITSSNIPKSSKTEDSTPPNEDTDEDGAEPISGPKTFKLILKSKSIIKAKTLKGITINEPSSAPAGGKSSSASKTYSAHAGKLKIVKMEDDPPLAIVMKELNELKLQISKKKSSYSRNKNAQQVPPNALQNRYKTQFKMNSELCGPNNHISENCYEVLFCKKCKRTNHRTCDHVDFMFSINANQHHNGQGESSSRSRPSRPSVSFPSCIHCGYNDHHSNDCLYYPTCEICGSYDHDTHDHNRIISLRRGINPRNPQHVTKNCKTYGSNVHTTLDHNDIEWFRYGEDVLAKGGKTGGFDQITNKDAIILYTLANGINIDYANIFWEDIILKLKKKQREKFVPYTRFISLMIMHKMKEGYRDDEVTQYPTQVFTVNNLALKPNQPVEAPFTDHMLAICNVNEPVAFKAPEPSSIVERVPQGTKPKAQPGHKKQSSLKQTFVYSKEETKGGSSKAPTGSKTGHSMKRKESSSVIDSNPSQPPVSTLVDPGMHKEDQQATGGPTSLGVTSEARANPQLNSGMSAFDLNKPIYITSFIIHSEFALGNDASAVSTAGADLGNAAPSDFV
ncbi:hypothetical protein Tco_1355456 [Tanacetum coccineum]